MKTNVKTGILDAHFKFSGLNGFAQNKSKKQDFFVLCVFLVILFVYVLNHFFEDIFNFIEWNKQR